jgi:hypothetical protein
MWFSRKKDVGNVVVRRPYCFALEAYGYGPGGMTADTRPGRRTHVVECAEGNPPSLCREALSTVPITNDVVPRRCVCKKCVSLMEESCPL